MKYQSDIEHINKQLYGLRMPDEPMHSIMFYFKVLNNVIDYSFPPNYLNYDAPYFKTYNEIKQFLSLAESLNPDYLHLNNVIIYHDDKNFYINQENIKNYEFKIIDPNESKLSNFHDNYENNFNIDNIDHEQKILNITIKNDIKYPHSEDSDYSSVEDYYYEEGLEEKYQSIDNPYNISKENLSSQYFDIRKKYNQKVIKNNRKSNTYLYQNQLEISDQNEEEEKK